MMPVPYSVERLIRLCKTWDFQSDVEDLPDCDDGEPRIARACRRVREILLRWREHHHPNADPWADESLGVFHVCDVALIADEYRRLKRIEEKVIDALGPPAILHHYD
jgi:hypothetical protein